MNSTLKSNATYSVIENAKNFAHITAYTETLKEHRATPFILKETKRTTDVFIAQMQYHSASS